MAVPPRDSEGRVIPHDDTDIPGDAYVSRYIIPDWLKEDPDRPSQRRLSSAAFRPSSKSRDPYQGMSVGLLQPMLEAGLPPTGRKGEEHEAVVRLRVGDLRGIGLWVGPDPLDTNPFHAAVWRVKKGDKKQLMKLYEWVDLPDDVAS